MAFVEITIVKLIDESFPMWVECILTDINRKIHVFREKLPVVEDRGQASKVNYPQTGRMRCRVLEATSDVVIIDTKLPDSIESMSGETRFSVAPPKIITA